VVGALVCWQTRMGMTQDVQARYFVVGGRYRNMVASSNRGRLRWWNIVGMVRWRLRLGVPPTPNRPLLLLARRQSWTAWWRADEQPLAPCKQPGNGGRTPPPPSALATYATSSMIT